MQTDQDLILFILENLTLMLWSKDLFYILRKSNIFIIPLKKVCTSQGGTLLPGESLCPTQPADIKCCSYSEGTIFIGPHHFLSVCSASRTTDLREPFCHPFGGQVAKGIGAFAHDSRHEDMPNTSSYSVNVPSTISSTFANTFALGFSDSIGTRIWKRAHAQMNKSL